MKIMIDVNIALDMIQERHPHYQYYSNCARSFMTIPAYFQHIKTLLDRYYTAGGVNDAGDL